MILLPQPWDDEALSLPRVAHLDQLHLLELRLVLPGASFLWLHCLLCLLEYVAFVSNGRLVVEVTAGRLLVGEVEGVIHELIVDVDHRHVAAEVRSLLGLSAEKMVLLLMRVQTRIELALDHINTSAHLPVRVGRVLTIVHRLQAHASDDIAHFSSVWHG